MESPSSNPRCRSTVASLPRDTNSSAKTQEKISRWAGQPCIKLWGDLYGQRGLYPEAVEEYRAAQLIANQDAGTPTMPLEHSSLQATDDLETWKQLAASMKRHTDAYKHAPRGGGSPRP